MRPAQTVKVPNRVPGEPLSSNSLMRSVKSHPAPLNSAAINTRPEAIPHSHRKKRTWQNITKKDSTPAKQYTDEFDRASGDPPHDRLRKKRPLGFCSASDHIRMGVQTSILTGEK
jgi:hypothetical protein